MDYGTLERPSRVSLLAVACYLGAPDIRFVVELVNFQLISAMV